MQLPAADTVYLGRTSTLLRTGAGLAVAREPGPASVPASHAITDKLDGSDEPLRIASASATSHALPTGNEPLPKAAATADVPGQQAIKDANTGNPYKLVATLVKLREATKGAFEVDGKLTDLGIMANAMASALGLSVTHARYLIDAMSRGGIDARMLADGVNALRGMPAAERAGWANQWLPTALTAAQSIIDLSDNAHMESLGASDASVAALGDLAALNFTMMYRHVTKFPNGDTVDKRAEDIRARTERRTGNPKGADAILADIGEIGDEDTPENQQRRTAFARELVDHYGFSLMAAYALVDAMRHPSVVGRMLAEGLNTLEGLDGAKGLFADTFVRTALAAENAEATMETNPFSRELGVMTEDEAAPVGALASLNAAMAEYKRLLARQGGADNN